MTGVRWPRKARPPRDALVCERCGVRAYQAVTPDGTPIIVGGGRVHAVGDFTHLARRKDKQRIPGVRPLRGGER